MLRLHAGVAQVFQFNIMDKTLKDYIERAQKQIEEERKSSNKPNDYPLYPEQQGEEDRPRNPYAPT